MPKQDNIPLAIGAILSTVLTLSLADTLIKLISNSFTLWQIFTLRSALLIPVLGALIWVQKTPFCGMPKHLGWTALRSMLLVVMWVFYYISLNHLQLAIAAAAYYTLPIFLILLSALFAGEKISPLGWCAVATGFCGVLLILKPTSSGMNAYIILPLVSALLYAVAMILTRTKCRGEHPLTLSLALNLAFILVGGALTLLVLILPATYQQPFLFSAWSAMDLTSWGIMILLAAALLVGSIGTAFAYQNGPASVIGAFDFAYVGFAVLWGIFIFSQYPDATSILGMVMIVGAGILAARTSKT